jgi:hypothetical protein
MLCICFIAVFSCMHYFISIQYHCYTDFVCAISLYIIITFLYRIGILSNKEISLGHSAVYRYATVSGAVFDSSYSTKVEFLIEVRTRECALSR